MKELNLSPSQKEVLDYYRRHYNTLDTMPSIRQAALALSRHPSNVLHHLKTLEKKRFLTRVKGYRNVRLSTEMEDVKLWKYLTNKLKLLGDNNRTAREIFYYVSRI